MDSSGLKVVAFDVDGTLYGKPSYFWRMFLSAFPFPILALRYNVARRKYRESQGTVETLPPDRGGYLHRLAILMGGSEKRTIAAVERWLYGSWKRSYRSVPARAGLRDAFLFLKQKGYRIAVLSDFPLEGKLKALGVDDLVELALCSEDTGYLKPDIRVFRTLLEKLGVEDASSVLFVGDSYQKDVLGSKRAGMRSCLVTEKTRIYPEADSVVHSMQAFVDILS